MDILDVPVSYGDKGVRGFGCTVVLFSIGHKFVGNQTNMTKDRIEKLSFSLNLFCVLFSFFFFYVLDIVYLMFEDVLSENAVTMVNKFGQKYHCMLPVQVWLYFIYNWNLRRYFFLLFFFSEKERRLFFFSVLIIKIPELS